MVSMQKLLVCALLVVISGFSAAAQSQSISQSAPTPARLIQPIDESKLFRLRGNVHPGAQAANDHGLVDPFTPLNRIVMVLQRSPQQESALEQLMTEQYDRQSPNFHHWLSPEEFGSTYGPSDTDIATITGWLQNHGFTIDRVSKGRVTIEFSGTAGQVAEAFHTEIHHYVVNGVDHIANNSDPEIPEALAPVVQGIASLHNFFPTHQHVMGRRVHYNPKTGVITAIHSAVTPATPPNSSTAATPASKVDWSSVGQLTYTNDYGNPIEDVTPADFANIYNVLPLWNAGITGTGVTIAISGVSDINLNDIATFQSVFGLPNNPPTVIHNGTDPGDVSGGQGENELDVEWSGAVAPNAKIAFVVTASTQTTFGGQLSDSYIVDNKTANIMSASYGTCELKLGTSGNAAYNAIWQQGAAEGISIMESAGDQGSAGCSSQDTPAPNADKYGLAVNGMASSPFVTAVGGTDLNWQSARTTYWNSSNTSVGESATGYMPELPWDSTCTSVRMVAVFGYSTAEQTCNEMFDGSLEAFDDLVVIAAGSGGTSNCTTPSGSTTATCSGGYAKPSWQTGVGVPADGKRDLPDISLFASGGFPVGRSGSAYLVCETINTSTCDYSSVDGVELQEIGGTSASSPAFAGVMALVLQKTGEAQGLANVQLYKFAASENLSSCNSNTVQNGNTCIIYDVTSGTNAQVCYTGDPQCVTNTTGDELGVLSGFSSGTGYDRATGLGTVNVTNLVNAAWPTSSGGTPSVSVTPSSIAFGNETVGVKSAAKPITVSNTGTVALSISSISVTGANTVSFAQTNGCPSSLGAGASCTIDVTFDPTGASAKAASITVVDGAGTQNVTLTGTGVAAGGSLTVNPATLSFGNQTVGVKSAAKTATLTNGTSAAVTGITITTSGNTSSFSQTNNCTSSLGVGGNCVFSVTFDPNGAVAKSMTITIASSAGTLTITSTGTGVTSSSSLTVSPSTLAFGNQTVGVKSAAKTATLTNNSSSAVTGIAISTSGNTSSFSQTNNCTSSLGVGGSCVFSVTFDPNGAVAKSMTITIASSAGTLTVTSTGTGVAGPVTVSPSTLAFGNQTVGVKSAPKTASLINETASTLTGIAISTSGNTTSFAQTNTCTTSLAPGANCTFSVTFDPNGAVAKSMTITIKDSAGTQTITSTGTGVN